MNQALENQAILAKAIEAVRQTVVAELSVLSSGARRKRIAAMSKNGERNAERVRESLRRRGEKSEAIWQAEIVAVEAPYWVALEAFRDDCPDSYDDD